MNLLDYTDIFVLICNFLPTIKEIIQLELLSKYHQNIIRTIDWFKEVKVKNDSVLEHVLKYYKFRWLNISSICDVNGFIKELKNCHTLNLAGTKITDASVKELKNCHTLYLYGTNITDANVKELKNCHTTGLRAYGMQSIPYAVTH